MRLPSLISPGALDELCELAEASPRGGCFVEVGVYQGGSASRLAEVAARQGRALYLYDTFTGIPMAGALDLHPVGDFGDTDAARIRAAIPAAVVVEGLFPQSLVAMPPVAFAHIDCDQYESIARAIAALRPLMVAGGAMLFDDYGCLDGATAAVHDLLGETNITRTRCAKALWRKEA
jgi:hypothetical protein